MKRFTYRYSDLQHDILTNSDGTNIKSLSGGLVNFVPPDDLLEDAIVPEITYTATNATSVDKTVKAWTYYCDSLSGCVDGTAHYRDGDGSIEKPWRSLDYALRQVQQKLNCWRGATCCYDPYRKGKYFQLKVKGTIDYGILSEYSEFRGAENVNNQWVQQFIISPWENGKWVYSGSYIYMRHVYGTVFNGLQIGTSDHYSIIFGSGDSKFNHAEIVNGYFDSCHGARFIDISQTRTTYDADDYSSQFSNCIGSDIIGFTGVNVELHGGLRGSIYNANVTIVDNSDEYYKEITGFRNFSACGFFNCSANVSGKLSCYYSQYYQEYFGYVDACGFYGNSGCTFYNCSATNQCSTCSDTPMTCRTPDF